MGSRGRGGPHRSQTGGKGPQLLLSGQRVGGRVPRLAGPLEADDLAAGLVESPSVTVLQMHHFSVQARLGGNGNQSSPRYYIVFSPRLNISSPPDDPNADLDSLSLPADLDRWWSLVQECTTADPKPPNSAARLSKLLQMSRTAVVNAQDAAVSLQKQQTQLRRSLQYLSKIRKRAFRRVVAEVRERLSNAQDQKIRVDMDRVVLENTQIEKTHARSAEQEQWRQGNVIAKKELMALQVFLKSWETAAEKEAALQVVWERKGGFYADCERAGGNGHDGGVELVDAGGLEEVGKGNLFGIVTPGRAAPTFVASK